MSSKNKLNRRDFLSKAVAIGAGSALSGEMIFNSCSGSGGRTKYTPLHPASEIYIPDLPDKAVDGKPIKAALIGCGGRGTGAACNFLDAGNDLSIVACADLFPDKIDDCRQLLKKEKGIDISNEMCFTGFDAYKKVCELPVDLVIIAPPSCFHSEFTKYAVSQGKHVFVEKPPAIDPVGYRTFSAAIKQAKEKELNVITGAQYHYDRPFVASFKKIQEGYIGKIVSGIVYYNTTNENFITRKPGWSDMEYIIRGHYNWNFMNGDQISNMLIHWIDIFVWFSCLKPVKVTGFGSRIRRVAGNVYDNFSMDFEFENNVHLFGMVRRIDNCDNMQGIIIQGDKGVWDSNDFSIRDLNGNLVWQYDDEAAKKQFKMHDMYTQEHIEMVNYIRQGKVIDIAGTTATSAMACIMARESAYTGSDCTWEKMIYSDLKMGPDEWVLGKVDLKKIGFLPLPGVPGKDS